MPPFKTRLRVLRTEHDWTQAELAAHVGVSRQYINSIEKDRFQPNPQLDIVVLHYATRETG
ncbi:MAG: helix-turn-helix domain-containing protein [Candidatus Acidiferrum sp.]